MICKNFIKENVAPIGTKQISVFNDSGQRVGVIPLNSLAFPQTSERLYSFGAISDVHVVYDTAEADLQRALKFFDKDNDIDFVCVCGDLTDQGTETELAKYVNVVSNYITKPVYAVAGNHEHYGSKSNSYLQTYTGQPLCYSFNVGNDVFIMLGISSATSNSVFYDGSLQWLYETLESNRDKRCFLFEHILPPEGSGDILSLYPYTKLGGTEGIVFKSLLKHYKNVVFFHGHSHMKFDMQRYGMTANYDKAFGIHSVHIPSLAVPRDDINGDRAYDTIYADSEGYVVDVYENGIHLKGRDFVKGEFLPIASYWLDTTLQTVEAGTYNDSTGTIVT
jgi:3',5'-cyclic AMP phosphodiesterase CpdA